MAARMLTYKRVASLLDCSVKTVRRLVEAGLLAAPLELPGVGPRFVEGDIERYLRNPVNPRTEPRGRDRKGQGGTSAAPPGEA